MGKKIRKPKKKVSHEVLANLAGNLLAGVVVFLRREDGATNETYSRVISRFASIRSTGQLRKELRYLGKVVKAAAPKSLADVGSVRDFRVKFAKRLVVDTSKTGLRKKKGAVDRGVTAP